VIDNLYPSQLTSFLYTDYMLWRGTKTSCC